MNDHADCRVFAWTSAVIAWIMASTLVGGEVTNPILLGISSPIPGDDEYRHYHPLANDLRQHDIESFLFSPAIFTDVTVSDEELQRALRKCHVLYLRTLEEGVAMMTHEMRENAERKSRVLAQWVRDGGGLLLGTSVVRYRNTDDQNYWNEIISPLDLSILREGVVDTNRTSNIRTEWLFDTQFWWTRNIERHPVTEGVYSLWFPYTADGPAPRRPGTAAMRFSADWRVIVSGETEASSRAMDDGNNLDLSRPGTYLSAPPVVAVRQFGKGRVVCYPVSHSHVVGEYGKSGWKHVVERTGDGDVPGNGMRLLINATRWLAEPIRSEYGFGTAMLKPWEKTTWPAQVTINTTELSDPIATGVESRGIIGAHTDHSDGSGGVADYAAAAKKAGLSFIVFSDPLELLSQEAWKALRDECVKESKDGFWACPGIEFSDHHDNRWVLWGEKVMYPPDVIVEGGRNLIQWDGKRLHQYFKYMNDNCTYTRGAALVSFQELASHGGHLEKLMWYYHIFPLAYEKDRLIADNTAAYRGSQRDLRHISVASFTRIRSPNDVAAAAATATTRFPTLEQAKRGLDGTVSDWEAIGYASQGPQIRQWAVANSQMGANWRFTRGGQRAIARLVVHAEEGVSEVLVHDGDQVAYRRFQGNGSTDMVQEFELVHDRQHWLMLEVVDQKGRRAFSPAHWVFSYNEGHMRCGDNANFQDTGTGVVWPDREQNLPVASRPPRGTFEEMYRDGACPLEPLPVSHEVPDTITIAGIGKYPKQALGKVLNVHMASTNIIIDSMLMDKLTDFQSPQRAHPGWVNHDVAENEYFERVHTSYFIRDRQDWYLIWGARRGREGREAFEGNLIWNEGEFRFKKDCILDGNVPIPLVRLICPRDKQRGFGGRLIVQDAERGRQTLQVDETRDTIVTGRLASGGFLSQVPCGRWHPSFLAPPGSDFTYSVRFPKDWIDGEWSGDELVVGLGAKGQAIKTGTVLKYRFAAGVFYDRTAGGNTVDAGWRLLDQMSLGLNFAGGIAGYPVRVLKGMLSDATFFCTVTAKGNEASFSAGPHHLPFDLPVKIVGIEDNGCAAVFSSVRPWFRFVPIHAGAAWFQEPIETENQLWVGNIFLSDEKAIRLTAVVDGLPSGATPFVEIHNPTTLDITTRIWSPPETPIYGGTSARVAVKAGSNVCLHITPTRLRN